jgi:hypothetical protein
MAFSSCETPELRSKCKLAFPNPLEVIFFFPLTQSV